MRPLVFVWPYWLVFWAVVIWAFSPELRIVNAARKPAARSESPDAGSYRVIVFGGGIAALLAFPLAWMPLLRVSTGLRPFVFVLGIIVMIAGSILRRLDRKSTRLNSSHLVISYAVFCLKKKKNI